MKEKEAESNAKEELKVAVASVLQEMADSPSSTKRPKAQTAATIANPLRSILKKVKPNGLQE